MPHTELLLFVSLLTSVHALRASPIEESSVALKLPRSVYSIQSETVQDILRVHLNPPTCPVHSEPTTIADLLNCTNPTISDVLPTPLELTSFAFTASLFVCDSPLSSGFYGAVFSAVILCSNELCASHYKATTSVPLGTDSNTFARKVAVKFAFALSRLEIETIREKVDSEFSDLTRLYETHSDISFYPEPIERLNTLPVHLQGRQFIHSAGGSRIRLDRLSPVGFVMEYLPGWTLKEELTRADRFGHYWELASCYTAQVALIQAFTSAQGLFHRETHLENFMVLDTCQDFVLVVDGPRSREVRCKRLKAIDTGVMDATPNVLIAVHHTLVNFLHTNVPRTEEQWGVLFVDNAVTSAMLDVLCEAFHPARQEALEGVESFIAYVKKKYEYQINNTHAALNYLHHYMKQCWEFTPPSQ